MRRLYLDLQDPITEAWLADFLRPSAVRVMDEESAHVAVLSTESPDFEARCKTLTRAGCTAFVLTPENKGTVSARISQAGGKSITYRQREDAMRVLQRLVEVLVSPPEDQQPLLVAVYSARQAGGSFVSWNLCEMLRRRGQRVSMCSLVEDDSPFHVWISDESITFGSSKGHESADIWIVDASGQTEVIPEVDLAVVVSDEDPAKPIPTVQGAIHVKNRVWPNPDTPVPYIPDFGRIAVQGMHTHTAAVLLDEQVLKLFDALWRHWNGEPLRVMGPQSSGQGRPALSRPETGAVDGEDHRLSEGALKSPTVSPLGGSAEATTGELKRFDFDDDGPVSGEVSGQVLRAGTFNFED